ncbi:MAG: hypothetical protein ABIT08_02675 [Bacteroidia bacterium]
MKVILSFLISVSVLVMSFSRSMIYFSYQANKKYISKHLCENRTKPQLHCNGKCQVIKKMNEENKKQNHPTSAQNNFELQWFARQKTGFDFSLHYCGQITYYYFTETVTPPYFSFFHPPCV